MSELVFIVPFRVSRKEPSIMPEGTSGAYVSCYSKAASYEDAVGKSLAALAADGMQVDEIMQPIHSMGLSEWSKHVGEQWPDHVHMLPGQSEFEEAMLAGKVVYGPFGAF